MDKLLAWSIEATQNPANAGQPDSKLLAKLFGTGSGEAEMKVLLQSAVEAKDLSTRIESLEEFKELVEDTDNANNMGHLWQPLLYLVDDQEPKIRQGALCAVGAIVQNNDKSQQDLLKYNGSIPLILKHILDKNEDVAASAAYALSSAIGHCPSAYDQFVSGDGWRALEILFKNANSISNLTKPQVRSLSLIYNCLGLHGSVAVVKDLESTNLLTVLRKLICLAEERSAEDYSSSCERLFDIRGLLKSLDPNLQF